MVLRAENPPRLPISCAAYPVLDAGYIILRRLGTICSRFKNGGWALNTLGSFIVGPQAISVWQSWDRPWAVPAALKGLVPPSGACDGDSEIHSQVDRPCHIREALEENKLRDKNLSIMR